jgi:hypothetical protein
MSDQTPAPDALARLKALLTKLMRGSDIAAGVANDACDRINAHYHRGRESAFFEAREAVDDILAAQPPAEAPPAHEHTCHSGMNPPFPYPCKACEVEALAEAPPAPEPNERMMLHTLIADLWAEVDPDEYVDLAARVDAVLTPCDEAGVCQPATPDDGTALSFLERQGYRRCDIAACNCGKWHGGYANERLREISDTLAEAGAAGGITNHSGVLWLRDRAERAEEELAALRQAEGPANRSNRDGD